MNKIPIIVLSRNEARYLYATILSLIKNTKFPHEIIIVDNNSNCERQAFLLKKLQNEYNIKIIKNEKNNWVLGFNIGIEYVRNNMYLNQEYIVLTDGDILVPNLVEDMCWLGYLVKKMKTNVTMGKIGLGLNLDVLNKNSIFIETLGRENKYINGPVVDNVILAPVDTTLAIYRTDVYITQNFKIVPGHASLIKPYYYVGRTRHPYLAKHLGWRNYAKPNEVNLRDKIICFTKYAGYIDPTLLKKAGIFYSILYKIIGRIFKLYWGNMVIIYWLLYIIKRFPRELNEIQFKLK